METMKESEPREGAHPSRTCYARSAVRSPVSLHLGNFTVLLSQLDVAPAAAESEVL